MKLKIAIIQFLFILSMLLNNKNASADITDHLNAYFAASNVYVICADRAQKWDWLNAKKTTAHGFWGIHFNYLAEYHFNYFFLSEGKEKYAELAEKCIKEFGAEFKYPQPANYGISEWSPFAINQNEMFPASKITKTYVQYRKKYRPSK